MVKFRKAKGLLLLTGWLIVADAFANETIYFGERTRTVEINSAAKTLFVFPEPPLAINCHPSSHLAFDMLQSKLDIEQFVPATRKYDFMEELTNAREFEKKTAVTDNFHDPILDSMIEVSPKKKGSTNCTVKLASGASLSLKVKLDGTINRPIVEFKSFREAKKLRQSPSHIYGLDLFRSVLQGEKLHYLLPVEVSKRNIERKKASYDINSVRTDGIFKAWVIAGKVKSEFKRDYKLEQDYTGQMIYSVWSSNTKEVILKKGESFTFYLLSAQDLVLDELERKLP